MTRTYRDLYITYSGIMPIALKKIPKELYKDSLVEIVEDI
jgi:hypothetical protein